MKTKKSYSGQGRLNGKAMIPLLVLAGILGGCGASRNPTEDPSAAPVVAVVPAMRQDLSRGLELAAELRPFQEIDVHPKVAGYLKEIYVDVGDHVRAGQLLATLEIPELKDEVLQAQAAVRQSEEEIKRAQADLERAQSDHEVAHLAAQRLVKVMETQPNLVAQQDVDDATGRDRATEAQVAAAKAALAAAQRKLEVSRANEDKIRSLFDYSRITAPFSGVITQRYADTGAMIQAGTSSQTQAMPLVKLAQNDLLRLVIPVPESVAAQIHLGSPVQVRVPALGDTFLGKVARFADQVDTATRTMHTEVDVANPQLKLVPGMYAYASLLLEQKHATLTVPVQALNRSEDHATIWIVNAQHKIEEVPVTLGIETPSRVEVLSGLRENDLVVVGGRRQFHAGETVQTKVAELPKNPGGS